MLDILRPLFRGDWAPYGESLQLADASHARPSVAQWLEDSTHLNTALTHHAESLGNAREMQAVASDWMLRYLTALLPPIVALASLTRHRIPMGWHEMALTLDERGVPTTFVIGHIGVQSPGADTAARYDVLVWQHLEPLIALVNRQTRVPTKILRGNVRRSLLGIFGQALALVGTNTALSLGLFADRRQLVEAPIWSDGRRNPLFLPPRQTLTLHANCCLAYRLPRTGYCGACPLAPEHRKARPRRTPPPLDQSRLRS